MDFIDIRRAYFHANAIRDVYIELPPEDHEEGKCGKLLKSLYGTRDAAQNWERCYVQFMTSVGFTQGRTTPCVFYNEERDLRVTIHGDDFIILGWEGQLNWFWGKVNPHIQYGPASKWKYGGARISKYGCALS